MQRLSRDRLFSIGLYKFTFWQIWDVLSNEEVVKIVALAPRASAARALVESATRAWRSKYPYVKVDDCAVVCLFLTSSTSDISSDFSSTGEEMSSGNSSQYQVGS